MKPIIILLFCGAIAIARHLRKQRAAGRADPPTHRHRAAIRDVDGVSDGPKFYQQLLMKLLLDRPEIGRLLGKLTPPTVSAFALEAGSSPKGKNARQPR